MSSGWNCPTVPQGGLMSALVARAMMLELGLGDASDIRPDGEDGEDGEEADADSIGPGGGGNDSSNGMTLRSLTTVYAAAVPSGPVTIDVEVLRRGRSMSQAMATVHGLDDDAGHTTVAVFGRPRPGFEFTDLVMPDVPDPDDCPSFRDPLPEGVEMNGPPFAFWDMVEGRPALGHAPWETYEPTSSDNAMWYRLDDSPRRADGTLDPLALVVYGDTMPGSVRERMGPGHPEWYPPSADLTVHLLRQPRSEWILGHSRARHSGDGYASLEMRLWDPAVGLVAHSSQIMYYVFPNGDGPSPTSG